MRAGWQRHWVWTTGEATLHAREGTAFMFFLHVVLLHVLTCSVNMRKCACAGMPCVSRSHLMDCLW